MKRTHVGRTLLAAAISAAVGAANAADPKAGQLEEIVVTATRHEESLSKVPISVTALTQETLDVKGIKDFQDVVRFTPGVTIDNSGTNAISIRGISSSGGAGTTGIYLDDTPIQMRAVGFNPDDTLPKTFDLDRVEVLRGPQGTLFGSGSEGGTVRYIMNQPSVTKESTYVRSELSTTRGGDPSVEGGIAHGGPIIDGVLGYRASIWYRHDGGWINRVDPTTREVVDARANRADATAIRLALLWQPTESVSVTPSVMYQNSRKHDQSTFWDAYSNVSAGQFNNATPERIPNPDEYYLPALKIEVDAGKTRLISNTSYYHRNELTGYQGSVYSLGFYQTQSTLTGSCGNYAGDPLNGVPCSWYPLLDGNGIHLPSGYVGWAGPNVMTNRQEGFTQEVRWQSNDPASALTWTVGAFFSTSRERSIEVLYDPQIQQLWNDLLGTSPDSFFGTSDYTCNDGNPQGYALPNCASYLNDQTATDRQIALFGEGTYALSERWKITLGGRLSHQSFDLQHRGDGYLNFGLETATASHSENSFTPKASVSFQATPNDLYYATYAKGYRPGGGNSPLPPYCDGNGGLNQSGYANGAPLAYNSDTTQSYEFGTKNNFSNRLRIASSVYYIKWQNIQQSVYVAYNCGLQFTDNLGTAAAKGFDVQLESVLGGGFTLDAALGYTSARYTESTPAPKPLLASAGDAISGEGAADGSPASAPPWTLSMGLQYNFAVAERDTFVRFDWEYTSENHWLTALQDPASTQYNPAVKPVASTQFASLRGGVTLGNSTIALFVDNLFDTRTITNYQLGATDYNIPTDSGGNYLWNQPSAQKNSWVFRPRTIGITFTYRL